MVTNYGIIEFICVHSNNATFIRKIKSLNDALKGTFSSGIEGALASTLNHDFNWKQLRNDSLYFSFDIFKVYLSNIDSETAEI